MKPSMKPLQWLAFAVIAAALAGCATLPDATPDAGQQDFEVEGRAAIRYGNEAGSTRIAWRHGTESDDMLITGPLGQGIARITRRGGEVTLTTADAREHRASDAESLTESVLGWRMPLTGLPDWIRGRPVAGRQSKLSRDDAGRLAKLEQDDWKIEYLAWNGDLPSRMTLAREGAAGPIELRLIIDQWKSATP
jgi:outer membrane lipoprotein LolB